MPPVAYKQLKLTNPEYDPRYWRRIRALYAGGKKLLGDSDVMHDIFPKHLAEEDWVYDERKKRAFVLPYMGQLLDFIVAALSGSPVELSAEGAPEYYDELQRNVSAPGARPLTMTDFLRRSVLSALMFKRSWALVDLPKREGDMPRTRAEEEQAGLLDGYIIPVDPESVLDWEIDEAGTLLWAMILSVGMRRISLDSDRDTKVETYTYYDRDHWERYVVSYSSKDKPPSEEEVIAPDAEGSHSFGRVPLAMLELSDGLWAGEKLESVAMAHFNMRNALTWGMCKGLFPVLMASLGKPDALNPAGEDPGRALKQPIGQGRVFVLGDKDRLAYVQPDPAVFQFAAADLATLRDEMHRIVCQMALSVDNSGAALQRSGLSKQMDQVATTIILEELGRAARDFATELFGLVARGRGEGLEFQASGMSDFDNMAVSNLVEEALNIKSLDIPSPTFQRILDYEIARRYSFGATDEELSQIEDEIEQGHATVAEKKNQVAETETEALDTKPEVAIRDVMASEGPVA